MAPCGGLASPLAFAPPADQDAPMSELLRLDLRASLTFREDAESLGGNPAASWPLPPLAEGGEELFVFDEAEIIHENTDEGPSIARPLPAPRWSGRGYDRANRGAGTLGSDETEAAALRLEAGEYAFAQFRADSLNELTGAMDDFVRECWWERLPAAGSLFLRRIGEDGATSFQLLRRLGDGPLRRRRE